MKESRVGISFDKKQEAEKKYGEHIAKREFIRPKFNYARGTVVLFSTIDQNNIAWKNIPKRF